MSRQFSNKDHSETILQKLWEQCGNEEMCDVVLLLGTERKRIPAHRSILSVVSDYFNKLLNGNSSKEVEMPRCNSDILQRVIEYCYTGRIAISGDIAIELLKTAHILVLRNVVIECESFLAETLEPSNCFKLELLAKKYKCKTLLKKAQDYCLKTSPEDQFLNLTVKKVSHILASDDLPVESEEDVFYILMKWIEHNQSEREKHKAELLKHVRMPLMERSFLTEHVKPICTSIECLKIYTEALAWHLAPEINVFSEYKFIKPRSNQRLMGITVRIRVKKMVILYYCPQENRWMKWLKDFEYRAEFGLAVMENELYVVGGKDAERNILNTVICLDLKTMTFKEISPMQENRAWCRAAVLNGFLYAVGGNNGKSQLSSVEKFDPKTNKWAAVAPMSIQRCNFSIAELNQKLYVVGGSGFGIGLSSAECYDPIQNVWGSIASMSESRELPGVAVANGLLYVVGGYNNKKTVERYDPQTNKWFMICSVSQGMNSFSDRCTALRDKVVVCFEGHIEVYNSMTNEWKKNAFFKFLNVDGIFSYSNDLLTTEFIEN